MKKRTVRILSIIAVLIILRFVIAAFTKEETYRSSSAGDYLKGIIYSHIGLLVSTGYVSKK